MLLIMFLAVALSAQSNQSAKPSPAAAPQAVQPRRNAYVVMISIDGLIPEYYTAPAPLGLSVPTLTQMKLNGAYAEGVEGVYPTVTYPSHTTLITGVRPALHGIYQNRIFEAPTAEQTGEWYWFSKDLKTETLWSMAKRAGLVTANVGWPVTAGAEIDYSMPEIKDPKENPPTAKRTLQYSTPGLIEKAIAAMTSGDKTTDGRRTAVAEYVIQIYKPNLLLVHLLDLDGAHHTYGPRSPEALKTAERMDAYVARIIEATRKAGTFDKTTFFLVSDHGFAPVAKKFEPNVALIKAKLITLDASGKPTDWKAAAWPAGGSCAIVLKDANDKAIAKKVTTLFSDMLQHDGGPINRVLSQDEIKKLGGVPTAYLMLDAAPGFAFGEELTGPEIHEAKNYRGTHGQLPTRVEMRSSLIVYGAGARLGAKVVLARMIDIGPTAAAILGLRFENAEGTPMAELIKPDLIPPAPPKSKKKKEQPK
jgi:predicted AlkP superfamily pyrophosphatase or phosphodiesterase